MQIHGSINIIRDITTKTERMTQTTMTRETIDNETSAARLITNEIHNQKQTDIYLTVINWIVAKHPRHRSSRQIV